MITHLPTSLPLCVRRLALANSTDCKGQLDVSQVSPALLVRACACCPPAEPQAPQLHPATADLRCLLHRRAPAHFCPLPRPAPSSPTLILIAARRRSRPPLPTLPFFCPTPGGPPTPPAAPPHPLSCPTKPPLQALLTSCRATSASRLQKMNSLSAQLNATQLELNGTLVQLVESRAQIEALRQQASQLGGGREGQRRRPSMDVRSVQEPILSLPLGADLKADLKAAGSGSAAWQLWLGAEPTWGAALPVAALDPCSSLAATLEPVPPASMHAPRPRLPGSATSCCAAAPDATGSFTALTGRCRNCPTALRLSSLYHQSQVTDLSDELYNKTLEATQAGASFAGCSRQASAWGEGLAGWGQRGGRRAGVARGGCGAGGAQC